MAKRNLPIRAAVICVVAGAAFLPSFAAAQAPAAKAKPAAGAVVVAQPGDAVRGEKLYTARCGACHGLDANRIGPKHRGVVGRKSASIADFKYTAALKKLNVIWTPANLDRWLENPTRMAPGTAMALRTVVPKDRADLIAYLAANPLPAPAKP
jgi:cytochrome c